MGDIIDRLFMILTSSIQRKGLIQVALSRPIVNKKTLKLTVRPVSVKGISLFQVTEFTSTQAFHRNVSEDELLTLLMELQQTAFLTGTYFTDTADYYVTVNDGKLKIKEKPSTKTLAVPSHNHAKNRILEEGTPYPFLEALGITHPSGKVRADKQDKFRQIQRFLEMIENVLKNGDWQNKLFSIVDFGCGKAYLTFALYYYLAVLKEMKVEIHGVDLKTEVMRSCQALAQQLQWTGLKFQCSSIQDYSIPTTDPLWIIALHACDTATDDVIDKGIKANAEVFLLAPCCQHEWLSKIHQPALEPMLKYPILKERFSALATDALRALKLEAAGHSVKIVEFVDSVHTPKNLMIIAEKKKSKNPQKKELEVFTQFLLGKD